MSVIPERSTMLAPRCLSESHEKWTVGIRGLASVALLALVTACSNSLGEASYSNAPNAASTQGTAVKDLALNEYSTPRLAPPPSSDITREVPAIMSQVGTSADDGGYQYYEPVNGTR
jgi:hypothetical protein